VLASQAPLHHRAPRDRRQQHTRRGAVMSHFADPKPDDKTGQRAPPGLPVRRRQLVLAGDRACWPSAACCQSHQNVQMGECGRWLVIEKLSCRPRPPLSSQSNQCSAEGHCRVGRRPAARTWILSRPSRTAPAGPRTGPPGPLQDASVGSQSREPTSAGLMRR
jgi:hypothetical protein